MAKRLRGTKSPFRECIRSRREELKRTKHLKQVDIARALGIESPEFVSMVEQGRRNLDLNKVPALADVLQLDRVALGKLALYESAPMLYLALFGDEIPGSVAERDGSANVPMFSRRAIELLGALPEPVRRAFEELIEVIARYELPAYRTRE
jgi:transcriptional regulator with XRE-family HTH domain